MLTFLMMMVLIGLALAVGVSAQQSLITGRMALQDKQAFYVAESGWQRARQALGAGTWQAAAGTGNAYTETFGSGEYRVTVLDNSSSGTTENGSTDYTITAEGYVPNSTTYSAKREVHEYQTNLTAANTNQSLTATATASSTKSSNTASKAKDNDTGTKWQANNKGPNEWLKMDYAAAVTIDKIVIRDDGAINSTFRLEWSNDNAAWTTIATTSLSEVSNNVWEATFAAVSHRYFRAVFTDIDSNDRVGIKEMEAYNRASRTVTFSGAGDMTTEW